MTLEELGLVEGDFNFEINTIGNYIILKITVKGISRESRLRITREKIEDFNFYNLDAEKMLENVLKQDAIFSIINDIKCIRKLKLKILNEKNN